MKAFELGAIKLRVFLNGALYGDESVRFRLRPLCPKEQGSLSLLQKSPSRARNWAGKYEDEENLTSCRKVRTIRL